MNSAQILNQLDTGKAMEVDQQSGVKGENTTEKLNPSLSKEMEIDQVAESAVGQDAKDAKDTKKVKTAIPHKQYEVIHSTKNIIRLRELNAGVKKRKLDHPQKPHEENNINLLDQYSNGKKEIDSLITTILSQTEKLKACIAIFETFPALQAGSATLFKQLNDCNNAIRSKIASANFAIRSKIASANFLIIACDHQVKFIEDSIFSVNTMLSNLIKDLQSDLQKMINLTDQGNHIIRNQVHVNPTLQNATLFKSNHSNSSSSSASNASNLHSTFTPQKS